jgi:ABC-2 type transport system permease protein
MNKTWLVMKHEYLKHVAKKRFLLAVFSLPFFIIIIIGIGFLSVLVSMDNSPIGYVDYAGILDPSKLAVNEDSSFFDRPIEMIAFSDETTAREALSGGKIQAYYVLNKEFLELGEGKVIADETPGSDVSSQFYRFVKNSLLRNYDPVVAERIIEGVNVEIQAADDNRLLNDDNFMIILLPILAGILFLIAINISGGYLLQAVVEEKENRTMEIIVTSISPTQLMAGKIIGNLSVGLTQLIIWIIFGLIGVAFAMQTFPALSSSQIDSNFLFIIVLTFIPAFVMISAMMAAMGATTTDIKEAQQVAGLFTIPITIPFWFFGLLMENPNSPLSIFLSIFPFTAPVSLPLRVAFSTVPVWQTILTISFLVGLAVFSLWVAGRAFRLGMLRYGKRLSIKELFQKSSN